MKHQNYSIITVLILSFFFSSSAAAGGIVSKIVNSPLSATGTVKGAHTGVNVYLQSSKAPGIEFMNPSVPGYGIPAGGRIEVELQSGYKRIKTVKLAQKSIMLVTGAPQQGLPGKKVGYRVGEGANPNTFTITPTNPEGLPAEQLMSPAPGAKIDPVRNQGLKVFHIGLLESAFINDGNKGSIIVRIIDGNGKTIEQGSAAIEFIEQPVPQLQPSNFPDANRNHNWQVVKLGDTLGQTPNTLPIAVTLYNQAKGVPTESMVKYKQGILGAGVMSTQQLMALKFQKPEALARYNGGLILQDTDGDGRLDPQKDRIIGGVIGKAPNGAKGQELKSLDIHRAIDLSRPTTAFNAKFGGIFGGATMLLQFTTGDKRGKYRPTLALLSNPDDINSSDGSLYTFTIVAK
jgi:hypothetical protein